jgi:hypothetical protein
MVTEAMCYVWYRWLPAPDDLVLFFLSGDRLTWSSLQKELKSVLSINTVSSFFTRINRYQCSNTYNGLYVIKINIDLTVDPIGRNQHHHCHNVV